ncbi:two-component response regulator [Salmonella enterica subsp. arizonae]|uniref:Two-component response regulator n=1 Tax=Salmonella enterica subsp. arizonae TaxID=59203 RepID=A0A379TKJ0_SALER|nr:two-component response regulator [Salmonella enterica subsp. arizonae]
MINVLIVDDDAMVAELNRRYVAQISGFSLLWNRFNAGKSERVYLQ